MNNEKEENKKAWETPEIIDLDVNIYTKTGAKSGTDGTLGS